MQRHSARSARSARTKAWAFLSIATLCTALACSNLLDVKAPDAIGTGSLEDPLNALLLVQSTIGDFDCALGGYVVASGLMSGELQETTLTASRWSYDRRDIDPNESAYATNDCESIGTYTPIQTARFTADHALRLLEGWTDAQVPHRTNLIAHAAAFGGYSRILLGEAFCTAAIDLGPQLTSNQIFSLAISKFDTAVTAAQADPTNPIGDGNILNLALLGRARAELDAGNSAAAAADAALIPPNFTYDATYDAATSFRTNRVFSENNGHSVTVSPQYDSISATDPRVPVTNAHRLASDEQTPLFLQGKYADGSSPIVAGSYIEAQLILAEATGGPGAITILNSLRATKSLPPLDSSSDPAVIKADIAQERARWLWLEGQHLYDVRRFSLPLNPAAGQPYSITYSKGGTYGTETCMPIPPAETNNNPNARNPPAP
ncbi:MAG: RagB/SusD protein [Myxococcales bacterium]|nr:RagB/SusD protein [Myxococcales bacterium]